MEDKKKMKREDLKMLAVDCVALIDPEDEKVDQKWVKDYWETNAGFDTKGFHKFFAIVRKEFKKRMRSRGSNYGESFGSYYS